VHTKFGILGIFTLIAAQSVFGCEQQTAINLETDIPSPSVFGQAVTFTATVTSCSAPVTVGTVIFTLDGNVGSPIPLTASGTASFTTSSLSVNGGVAHSVAAGYSGASGFDPQFTSGFEYTVARASTTTVVTSNVNPSVSGQPVTFTATVAAVAPGAGTPTGSVAFTVDGTPQAPVTLSGGKATLTTAALNVAGSPHSVSVQYYGDANFNESSSLSLSQTVAPANTVTSVGTSPNPSNAGAPVTITATVAAASPGSGTPTGTVSFFDGVTLLGSSALLSGQAALTTSVLIPGGHTTRATYSGSADYNNSTQTSNHTVNKAATTTTVSSGTNPSVVGQTLSLTATVTSAYPGAITGSVTFFDGATSLGAGSVNGSGQAAISTSFASAGGHSITAVYNSDATYASSTSSPSTQTVNAASTTTTLASSGSPSVFGQSVTFTATVAAVAPGAGTPTGSVQFKEGVNVLGTGTLTAGTATFSTSALSVATHSVTATYLGDPNFVTSASSATNQVVNQAATTTALVSSLNPSVYATSVTFTATVNVTSPGAGTPTGTVTFKDGAATLGSGTLNASRVATFSTSALTGGSHSITAAYSADANFSASTSSVVTQVVNRAATSTALSSTGPALVSSTQTFTATVTSSAGTPTGTVTFTDGPTILGTVGVNNVGVATLGVLFQAGLHSVVAKYNGDGNFNISTSAGSAVAVGRPDTTISTPVLRSGAPNAGETLTFAVTVTGEGRITGIVTFRDNNVIIGTAPVDALGTAVVSARLALGNHMIVATYEGDPLNNTSTSGPLFLTVRGAATVTLTSSANPSAAGASVTFTAAVAAAATGGPAVTGTVTFTDGTRALGSATLVNGQASVVATGLTSGDHSILAGYSGDTVYQPANSTPLTQKVDREHTSTALDAGVDANGYFLLANVSPAGSGTPTGAVTFEDANTNTTLGSGTLANGTATLRLADPLPVGHRLRAVYPGDTSYATSSSNMMPFIAGANAFSFAFTFAPDSIVSIFGADLADSTVAAPSLPLPTTLGGVTVKIIDAAGVAHNAAIYFVSAGQINIVVPGDLAPGPARLFLTRGSLSISIPIVKSAPSLASGDGSGAGPAAAHILRVHGDGSQDPLVVVTGASVPFGNQTDSLYLILYGSGFRNGQGTTSCTLNGQPVTALYAGPHATYPGLDQINLQIPESLRGAGSVTVNCAVAGQTSNTVTINVQ
jgi:uncharacterized protein (TIGR03437 family)